MPEKGDKSKSSGFPLYFQEHPWHLAVIGAIIILAFISLIPKTGINGIFQSEVSPRVEEPKQILPLKTAGAVGFVSLERLRAEQAYGIVAGDMNNDGKTDIIVSSYNQKSVIYFNKDGTFEASPTLGEARYASSAALGDFNKDGWQDVVLLNNRAFSDVWLNNKDGTFSQVHLPKTDSLQVCCKNIPLGAAIVADLNNDGNQDIVLASDRKYMIFTGDGSGAFETKEFTDIQHSTSLVAADMDEDGKIDFVVGTDFAKNYVLTNNGDGAFTKTALPGDLYHTTSLSVADLDKDGDLDIVAGNNNQENLIYYNEAGTFKLAMLDKETAYTYEISVADLNNDDYPDVVVANFNQESYYYINKHDGTFDRQKFADAGYARGVAAADVDGDGDVDIVVARSGNQNSEIYANTLIS